MLKILLLDTNYFNVELVSKGESPWVIRAKNIKAEVAVNVDMERKLQQAAEEIRELFKELKLKVIQFV